MPYQWTAERERRMLLLAISSANLRPSTDTWTTVAALLGEGLTASAVSQKYYKLRNESARLFEGQSGSTPSTPAKRKASNDEEEKKMPPSKRARKPKREPLDGEPFSDASNSPTDLKVEGVAMNAFNPFPSFSPQSIPGDFFIAVNGQVKAESSGNASFTG
ncbi:uncharacterized protein Z518_00005 [Rhinocladiella mackenziei CBS 650.93]|uniref:Rhinocladiella mackenziei CBS 650.93 unplaced genomic scaffold supercont1.1, whole genome shotgun sequence n=1 Tax=Rhinocladiella mackenziei CBS 650.93 TaxID=1442369 RepID=A0A0D2G307_9EURO|nr:uncharacterized protein Z518_00005 [Rhinocladiella mackenziei CBS 650.93]KIX08927.1 hypothetical protein Z518_00005 [Rhinocladiella mackenziei CBS 650.93]